MLRLRAAVVGDPVSHSLSPVLHQAAWRSLGMQGEYARVRVAAGGLRAWVSSGQGHGWSGLSVTSPLKDEAYALAAGHDETAALTRVVNTLVPHEDGWRGLNTDVLGIERALREVGVRDGRTRCALPPALVLGAGATARSALLALARLGWRHVVLATRTGARPETLALADELGLLVTEAQLGDGPDGAPGDVEAVGVAVATLPRTALQPQAAASWARVAVTGQPPLLECAYADWPSPLAQAWAATGAPAAHGGRMLLHQAVGQVEAMTGRTPDLRVMSTALAGHL